MVMMTDAESEGFLALYGKLFGDDALLYDEGQARVAASVSATQRSKILKGMSWLKTDIKDSVKVRLETVIHRKWTTFKGKLGPSARIDFVNWVTDNKFHVVLWHDNILIFCAPDNDLRQLHGHLTLRRV